MPRTVATYAKLTLAPLPSWWSLLMLVMVMVVRPVECWQSPVVPSSPKISVWGRSQQHVDTRPATMLHSTTAPSSKSSSETSHDKDDRSSAKMNASPMPSSDDDDSTPSSFSSAISNEKTESSSSKERKDDDFPKSATKEIFPEHTKQTPTTTMTNKDPFSMPWSEVQDWALRDNLPKYTIMIPLEQSSSRTADSSSGDSNSPLVFALWRTMLNEVPELAGYPINFLQELHSRQVSNQETKMTVTPGLLPYLEDYTFASAGGVSGKVYGVPGLADGTRIETSSVTNIEVTLPQGFVRTSDGKAAYELGRPQREEFMDSATGKNLNLAKASLGAATAGSYELLQTVKSAAPETVEDADGLLLRLGASTGILLAGATAVNMLSHHLTVNVFWV